MSRQISDDGRHKQGRGQGSKDTWVPWCQVHDFGGRGRKHNMPSQVFKRSRHALSQIEANLICVVEMASNISDSREQFPLDPAQTKLIASQMKIPHPISPDKKSEIMSTDLLIDYENTTQRAIAVKSSSDLNDKRVIEKLQIEREYWKLKGVKWNLVTERDLPDGLIYNLRALRSFFQTQDELSQPFYEKVKLFSSKDDTVSKVVESISKELRIPSGRGLMIFKYLCSKRLIKFDYYRPFTTRMHLYEFQIPRSL